MMNKKFENDNFVLYSPDSLDYITRDIESILNKSLEFYKELFDVKEYRKIQINFFDSKEEFRNYIYELSGENTSLPEYATGTFTGGMINGAINPNIAINTPAYTKKKYLASHELFHIMYKELIRDKKSIERIMWFDEGMAQLFSGEFEDKFNDWEYFVKDTISKTKEVPNLNELSHGKSFETENYSGYKLSLIAVKTIYDKLGLEEFKKLMSDTNKIYEYGENILKEIFK